MNQVFSIAGEANRSDISATFFNPFATYNWKGGAGHQLSYREYSRLEKRYQRIYHYTHPECCRKLGKQTTSFAIGPRLHLSRDNHPAYRLRAAVTFVFSKKNRHFIISNTINYETK